MTSTEFSALKMTVPGSMPFAGAANASSLTEPGLTEPAATAGQFSMPEGFGTNYDTTPQANGANMVQRGQINYIGKMASYAPFMGKVGRDYFEFDPAVATAPANSQYGIGGYPRGAILTLVQDNCYLKIISLVDNNKVDFTGMTDTATYTDITNGTVDGVNWQYLSLDPKTLIDQSVVAEVPAMIIEHSLTQVFNAFKSSNDAALVVSGGLNIDFDREEPLEEEVTDASGNKTKKLTYPKYQYELDLIVSPAYDTLDDLRAANWKPVTTSSSGYDVVNGTVIFNLGTTSRDAKLFVTQAGKYYALGFYGMSFKTGGKEGEGTHPLAIKISSSTVKVQLKVLP